MENEQGSEQKDGEVAEALEVQKVPFIAGATEPEMKEVEEVKKAVPEAPKKEGIKTHIFALRATANREDQVMDFLVSNVKKKKMQVFSVIRPHGMRGYIFVEANDRQSAEEASFNIPYARGILPKEIQYAEIEHMLEQVKREIDIRKNDVVEIIAGPFKREQAKVTRIDKSKEEVVVELLGAAVPIPITVKMDAVKVIRRESEESRSEEQLDSES
ncbi:MAG: transcription elongation factor Spt5 [Candidatus Woesearchaeota archaeon]|jgi:transcriptional antiterminator NusG|nr:transcription elongation factor Spt5 [Candidatus Woesearchaeota archaeon]